MAPSIWTRRGGPSVFSRCVFLLFPFSSPWCPASLGRLVGQLTSGTNGSSVRQQVSLGEMLYRALSSPISPTRIQSVCARSLCSHADLERPDIWPSVIPFQRSSITFSIFQHYPGVLHSFASYHNSPPHHETPNPINIPTNTPLTRTKWNEGLADASQTGQHVSRGCYHCTKSCKMEEKKEEALESEMASVGRLCFNIQIKAAFRKSRVVVVNSTSRQDEYTCSDSEYSLLVNNNITPYLLHGAFS